MLTVLKIGKQKLVELAVVQKSSQIPQEIILPHQYLIFFTSSHLNDKSMSQRVDSTQVRNSRRGLELTAIWQKPFCLVFKTLL